MPAGGCRESGPGLTGGIWALPAGQKVRARKVEIKYDKCGRRDNVFLRVQPLYRVGCEVTNESRPADQAQALDYSRGRRVEASLWDVEIQPLLKWAGRICWRPAVPTYVQVSLEGDAADMCLNLRHLRVDNVWHHICQTAPSGSSHRRPSRVLRAIENRSPKSQRSSRFERNSLKPFCNATAHKI